MDIKRLIVTIFLLLLFGVTNYSVCFAADDASVQVLEKIDLPKDLNFTVSDICSEHAYFMQATANDLGNFAIYTRHVNPQNNSDVDFKKVYIDLYHYNGKFMCELSFTTPLDLAIELKNNLINIYFYNYMLVYDFTTQELSCYSIPEGAAINGGLYEQLREESFLSGDWTYSCRKAIDGYTKLTRSNNEQVQVLVELPGTGKFWTSSILVGGGFGVICTIFIVSQFKRKRQ